MKTEDDIYIQSLTDQEIVRGILNMDTRITQLYLYEKCYPLFKSLCTRWHIDCKDCVEFIDVIYLYLMTPNEKTGRCYLETFDFRCSFKCWLMTVSIYYCRLLYRKDMNRVDIDGSEQDEKKNHRSDVSPIGCEVREIDELRQGLCCKTVVLDGESKIT